MAKRIRSKTIDAQVRVDRWVNELNELYGELPPAERYAEAMRHMSAVIGQLQEDARGESWQLEDPYLYTLPIQAADHACVAAVKFFEHCALKHKAALKQH